MENSFILHFLFSFAAECYDFTSLIVLCINHLIFQLKKI